MSYETIAKAFVDGQLIARVRAAVAKEAFANETLGDTIVGRLIISDGPDTVLQKFLWPLCIAVEAEYEYAINAEIPNPGSDPGVISEGAIGSAVQANWPADVTIPPKDIYLRVVAAGEIPVTP